MNSHAMSHLTAPMSNDLPFVQLKLGVDSEQDAETDTTFCTSTSYTYTVFPVFDSVQSSGSLGS